ncbi:uncharacterized protein Tco025E_01216 [Trypanosoma conorhini]|uniref:SET domain-containing protein n=1 Tax=Trypanosoma conorhini TaxID=83891 RepID=A0A422Q967_9TRYP|nr:uncharacterized protein Tco025E_01216 [Trypanosoma conorhini]RNF26511.1 hypothetical protein Tco025E_01216 [Trypanosoma conorhini]
MQVAEVLKQKGNACFNSGDVDGAAAAYQEAIDFLSPKQRPEGQAGEKGTTNAIMGDADKLLALLYSNLSNVYHIKGKHDDSWQAAEQATLHDPTFTKAWLRYIQGRQMAGYPFEAFVTLLQRLRPLLRRPASSTTPKHSAGDVAAVGASLYEDLGLSKVLSHIELGEYEGGVGIVARKAVKPNDVILVEKRFETSFAELDLGEQSDLTTMRIVAYFAKKMYPHQRANSETWVRFNKQFKGCWPRSPGDMSADVRSELSHALRKQLPAMDDDAFESLFALAVMCRYNCFHSGFFRACALANHSCLANAAMKYNPEDETVTLIAVRPISAGEFVNVKYLSDAHFLMGVGKRREYLRSWLFWCKCDRCSADNESSATQEQLQCRQCHGWTHLPLTTDGAAKKDQDPVLPHEKPCMHCGATVAWSPESRAIVSQLIVSFSSVTGNMTYDSLMMWLLEGARQIAVLRVHPDNWLYRVLLYFFCVPMTSIVNGAFEQFSAKGWHSPQVEMLMRDAGFRRLYTEVINGGTKAEDGSQQTGESVSAGVACGGNVGSAGVAEPAAEVVRGGDVLYALCVLWRLISSFYPPYEGWSLHRSICRLVLFSHTNPNEAAALHETHALVLLRRHGRYLDDADASVWLHAYNRFKPTPHRKGMLSVKQAKAAFQS